VIVLSPSEIVRALLWINEAQDHVNSCADDFDDPEALEAATRLQRSIDAEWDRLGVLVEGRRRPTSILRGRLTAEDANDAVIA
jgi:hypothetical protein